MSSIYDHPPIPPLQPQPIPNLRNRLNCRQQLQPQLRKTVLSRRRRRRQHSPNHNTFLLHLLKPHRQHLCRNAGNINAQFAEPSRTATQTSQQIWSPHAAQQPHACGHRAFWAGMVDFAFAHFQGHGRGVPLSRREFPARNQATEWLPANESNLKLPAI